MTDLMLDAEKELSLLREVLQDRDLKLQEQVAINLKLHDELERARMDLAKALVAMEQLKFSFSKMMASGEHLF